MFKVTYEEYTIDNGHIYVTQTLVNYETLELKFITKQIY